MAPDTLARWQFASTTIYHFLIVPVSIGLALLVAGMQSAAYVRRGTESGAAWDRASRFWGRLLVISFAIGVVTGIVQEFQFGMNWSAYSRFVGDVFGAPLAMEGLIAFFLESTFLGLWVFGRDLLTPRLHLAAIWLAAIGTVISAYFILAANSFMQHPVGFVLNPVTHTARLTDIWAVLFQKAQLITFTHTLMAALLTGGAMLLSVSAWHLARGGRGTDPIHTGVAKMAIAVVLLGTAGASISGHIQGQVMTDQQPMKMAAAEALWNTRSHAPFSLFAVGDVSHGRNKVDIAIPDGLSILATNHPGGTVQGINEVQAGEVATYGPGNYVPIVGVTYWAFRLMIGFGVLAGLIAFLVLIQWWRGRMADSRWLMRVATWTVVLPLLANTAGWMFTEMGRQPWLVYGLLKTAAGVSTNVSNTTVAITLIGFSALYGVLGFIAARLFIRTARRGPDAVMAEGDGYGDPTGGASTAGSDGVLVLAP